MGKLVGWISDLFKVADNSKVERTMFDSDGYLYQRDTKVTATGAELNKASLLASADRVTKVAKVALGAADTGGGVLAWVNPEIASIIITRIVLDITTKSTVACTIDVGATATSATTTIDNLIDGLDINTAAGVFDNFEDQGTNGTSRQKLASGKWITASKATGAAAGTVGFAYIHYVVL